MALLGPNSLTILAKKVLVPVVIIERVVVYARKEKDKTHLIIHVMSDKGAHDTVVRKLLERVRDELTAAYEHECATGLETFRFLHTEPGVKIPDKNQLVWVRPHVGGRPPPTSIPSRPKKKQA